MSDLKSFNLSLSERCRALAAGCGSKARSFRNDKPRTQVLQLADDYERKARLAEVWKRRCETDLNWTLASKAPKLSPSDGDFPSYRLHLLHK